MHTLAPFGGYHIAQKMLIQVARYPICLFTAHGLKPDLVLKLVRLHELSPLLLEHLGCNTSVNNTFECFTSIMKLMIMSKFVWQLLRDMPQAIALPRARHHFHNGSFDAFTLIRYDALGGNATHCFEPASEKPDE